VTTRVAPLTAWLLGLLLGALDGFLGFEFPSLALGLFAVAAVLLVRDSSRAAGLGGLLLGAGGLWTFVLLRAQASCAAFNSIPNQGCVETDITPFVLLATIAALVGIGLTLGAARRSR
jgi:hypothetical protein